MTQSLVRRLAVIAGISVGITLATSVAAFPVQIADITAQWKSAWDLGTRHLLAETSVAQALDVQVVTGMGLVAAALARAHKTTAANAGLDDQKLLLKLLAVGLTTSIASSIAMRSCQ